MGEGGANYVSPKDSGGDDSLDACLIIGGNWDVVFGSFDPCSPLGLQSVYCASPL